MSERNDYDFFSLARDSHIFLLMSELEVIELSPELKKILLKNIDVFNSNW